MAKFHQLREHLPSLYRPEPNEDSMMRYFLEALGTSMDVCSEQMTYIMQSHWFRVADKAPFDAHAIRDRERRGLAVYNVRDEKDLLEIAQYEYITELAKIGNLVAIPPWREPPAQQETVENYRRRMKKIMEIYREGLGTINAIRTIVEAELPWSIELPLTQRIRSFAIEEQVALETSRKDVTVNGEPSDILGALMRWNISRSDEGKVEPTIYIRGVEPVADEIEATNNPIIELFTPDSDELVGLGIAYVGIIEKDETLRLQSARQSWLLSATGLFGTAAVSDANKDNDPMLNGPWEAVAGAPEVAFNIVYQTRDQALWLAGEQQLWRFDGTDWQEILPAAEYDEILSLCECKNTLFIGTDQGLKTIELYPAATETYSLENISSLTGIAIHQILKIGEMLALATEQGPVAVNTHEEFAVSIDDVLFNLPTYCIYNDKQKTYFGCSLGLLYFDEVFDHWYILRAEEKNEQQAEWERIEDLESLPDSNTLFIPAVKHITETSDLSLWFGTDHGLMRYYARHQRDFIYKTVLEAYPDLISASVNDLRVDERGLLWIATENGLFRFDGRDISQFDTNAVQWLQLGRADSLYPNNIEPISRGVWRFDRGTERWQQYDYQGRRWADDSSTVRSLDLAGVKQALITRSVIAHLGSWDGTDFTPQLPVPITDFIMRAKPDEQTIVSGGLVALPEIPEGNSTWRYLQLEADDVIPPADLPWWSSEGRLVPPPEMDQAFPGRYRENFTAGDGKYDESLFAYCPSAKVSMTYTSGLPIAVRVRLFKRNNEDSIDPVIIDRVWQGMNYFKPAGVPLQLAVEGKLVRGT